MAIWNYNNNNKLLLTRETDEFGKVNISNLPIGKYYIIEKEANSMYQITNDFNMLIDTLNTSIAEVGEISIGTAK